MLFWLRFRKTEPKQHDNYFISIAFETTYCGLANTNHE